MYKGERQEEILKWLQKDQRVSLSALSTALKVSEDTIRRDIKEMSVRKLLKEVRGGAVPHAPGPMDIKDRMNFAGKQKQEMAKKAIKLVKKGNVLILDGGTSTMAVASLLPKDLNLTVITNSFPVANVLDDRSDVEVLFAGGRLFRESFITSGHDTINFYKSTRADICFLGVCSIHLELGITGHHYEEAAIKKAMIESSAQVVALATPEKINTAEAFHICPINSLKGLITPSPDLELLQPYKQAGINVI
jgi:DeoR/GlpR family transcriptional regulator of sugar metabolism